jgi:hypothetical protein
MSINGTKVVLSGRGLHRYDKRQLARLAANVHVALAAHKPSIAWLSRSFGVGPGYISAALGLSPERRAAIIEGRDKTSFVSLLKAPARQLALPIPDKIDNAGLGEFMRIIEEMRTIEAAQ